MTRDIATGGIPECPVTDTLWRELAADGIGMCFRVVWDGWRQGEAAPHLHGVEWVEPLATKWDSALTGGQEVGKEEVGGRGQRGKRAFSRPGNVHTHRPCYAPSLSTAAWSGLGGEMHPFSKQRGISKTQSTEEDITANFFWEICFNFSESLGKQSYWKHTGHLALTTLQASSMQNQRVGPRFYKQGTVTLKTLKYNCFLSFTVPVQTCHGVHCLFNVELCRAVQTLSPLPPLQPSSLIAWDPPPSLQTQDQSTLLPLHPPGWKSQPPLPTGLPFQPRDAKRLQPWCWDTPCTLMGVWEKFSSAKSPTDCTASLPAHAELLPPCPASCPHGQGWGFAHLTLPASHQVPAEGRGDNSLVGLRRRPSSRGARRPGAEN